MFAVTIMTSTSLFGQFETSEVLGTVHDPSQGAIADAAVTLTNQDYAVRGKDEDRRERQLRLLRCQSRPLRRSPSRKTVSRNSLPPISVWTLACASGVDAELKVGAASWFMTITSQTLIETDSSEHSQVIGQQTIVDLPLNGRHYADLALLSTNVHVSPIAAFTFRPAGRRAKPPST